MKTKNLSLMIASVFAIVFFLAFASAGFTIHDVSPVTTTINAGDTTSITYTFNITVDQDYTSFSFLTPSTTNGGTWSSFHSKVLSSGDNEEFSVKLSFQGINTFDAYSSSILTSLIINGTNATGSQIQQIFPNLAVTFSQDSVVSSSSNEFCSPTSIQDGNLDLSVDVKNKGVGDDNTWELLDTIEVKVKLENNLDSGGADTDNLEDGVFKLKLLNGNGQDVADDLIWVSDDSGEYEFGSLDEGKKTDHTFIFRVNPAEFQEDNYHLVLEAVGKDDNSDEHCVDYSNDLTDFGNSVYYGNIRINQDSHNVVVDVADPTLVSSATASCEQKVTFTANVWNTGTHDYTDKILVSLYNSVLGIDQNQTIDVDLDAGDSTQVTFSFNVPKGIDEKSYDLAMTTYYDWDANHDRYDRTSDSTYDLPLVVSGNCVLPEASITATYDDRTKRKNGNPIAGKTLWIRATVTNTATIDSTYLFTLDGYSDWASDATINNSLTLAAGESKDILISLKVGKKVSGDQSFNIVVTSEGDVITQPSVPVTIEARSGLDFLGNNGAVAALIALITAIAIAIIIVLIVKSSKKKE